MGTDVAMENGETHSLAAMPTSITRLAVTVTKPIPYTFDLGNLLCTDANPLPPTPQLTEDILSSTARDCAQVLINQLLSTCPITQSSESSSLSSMILSLPQPSTELPRAKPVPADKKPTKWEVFAKRKGIQGKKRDGKKVYDEASGEWVEKYGYKGRNRDGENDWLVEVDEKRERRSGEANDPRKDSRAERKNKIVRQARKQRANESRGNQKRE